MYVNSADLRVKADRVSSTGVIRMCIPIYSVPLIQCYFNTINNRYVVFFEANKIGKNGEILCED